MEEKISMQEYLHSIRFYILFISVLFIGSIALGYMGFLSEIFSEPLEWIQQLSENIQDFTHGYPSWIIFLAFFIVLFLNNSFTCFLDIISGPLIGIFPMFSAFINGGLLGGFAKEEGLKVFLAIVPHGIFEIPAFLFSAAIGLRLGREILKRKGERHLKKELRKGLRVFLHLILPLLLIAALIESVLIVIALSF
ncbi:MAG: stage II sporulation protein M [Methanophagales archaeon]|nr:stage II sporulation protein M [Methanophagales archaeon]MCW3141017.1 stage II sporulation protein M [Methanophagales archaeon]